MQPPTHMLCNHSAQITQQLTAYQVSGDTKGEEVEKYRNKESERVKLQQHSESFSYLISEKVVI